MFAAVLPSMFWLPAPWLIPSWYSVVVKLPTAASLVQVVAIATPWMRTLRRVWRARTRPRRLLGLTGVLLAGACWASLSIMLAVGGSSRDGPGLCSRALEARVPCQRGELYRYLSLCIAGSLKSEAEYRPGVLPFMYPVPDHGVAQCLRTDEPEQQFPHNYWG